VHGESFIGDRRQQQNDRARMSKDRPIYDNYFTVETDGLTDRFINSSPDQTQQPLSHNGTRSNRRLGMMHYCTAPWYACIYNPGTLDWTGLESSKQQVTGGDPWET